METQQDEKTVVFIKPEAKYRRAELLEFMKEFGAIEYCAEITLTESKLRALYPDLNEKLWTATCEHLLDKKVFAMVIKGINIVQRIFEVIGTEVDPFDCNPNSLRYLFQTWAMAGDNFGLLLKSMPKICSEDENFSVIYYPNHLHRSRTPVEAKQQIKVLFNGSYVPMNTH